MGGLTPPSLEVDGDDLMLARILWCAALLGAMAPLPAVAADPVPEEDCRLLDLLKCQIHVIDRALVATERDGVVDRVDVKVGDRVQQGQPLARLRSDIAEALLHLAEERTRSDINERYARKVLEVARQDYETYLDLHSKGSTTEQVLRQKKLEFERSELSVEQAQFEFRIHQLDAERAAAELRAYSVNAPFSGTVRQVLKVPGESVRNGEAILELVNTDRVQVEGYGNLEDLWNLLPGAQVEVRLDAPELERFGVTQERFRGTLIHVDSLVQPVTGKVRVVAEVENRRNILRDGLRATMQIRILPSNLAPTVSP